MDQLPNPGDPGTQILQRCFLFGVLQSIALVGLTQLILRFPYSIKSAASACIVHNSSALFDCQGSRLVKVSKRKNIVTGSPHHGFLSAKSPVLRGCCHGYAVPPHSDQRRWAPTGHHVHPQRLPFQALRAVRLRQGAPGRGHGVGARSAPLHLLPRHGQLLDLHHQDDAHGRGALHRRPCRVGQVRALRQESFVPSLLPRLRLESRCRWLVADHQGWRQGDSHLQLVISRLCRSCLCVADGRSFERVLK